MIIKLMSINDEELGTVEIDYCFACGKTTKVDIPIIKNGTADRIITDNVFLGTKKFSNINCRVGSIVTVVI